MIPLKTKISNYLFPYLSIIFSFYISIYFARTLRYFLLTSGYLEDIPVKYQLILGLNSIFWQFFGQKSRSEKRKLATVAAIFLTSNYKFKTKILTDDMLTLCLFSKKLTLVDPRTT